MVDGARDRLSPVGQHPSKLHRAREIEYARSDHMLPCLILAPMIGHIAKSSSSRVVQIAGIAALVLLGAAMY
jgi:hypothetical protein